MFYLVLCLPLKVERVQVARAVELHVEVGVIGVH